MRRKFTCENCGGDSVIEKKLYLPDFIIENGFKTLLEVKGRFTPKDRKKMKSVALHNPEWKILMVFQNPNVKLSKKSKKKYWNWAEDNGFEWVGFKDFKEYCKKKISNR